MNIMLNTNILNVESKILMSRERTISQIESAQEERFLSALEKSKRPTDYEYLIVDSSLPIDSYIQKVLVYINE